MKLNLIFFLLLAAGWPVFSGCTSSDKDNQLAAAGEYYTCPMHPQVRSDKPGACPVCNMTLIKVSGNQGKTEAGIKLSKQQQQLANIGTYTVASGKVGAQSTLTGQVVLNQNASEIITARVPGRIDKLLVKTTGDKVRKGQAMYEIYSEQLLAAQQEYLLALNQEGIKLGSLKQDLAASSRQKLLLWGMTASQISSLAKTGKPNPRSTYFSPVAGTVLGVSVQEGAYVSEGSPLFQVANLSSVWVQAQLYPGETGIQFQKGQVQVVAEAFPKDTLAGELVLKSPALEANRQINLSTFKVENTSGKLKPGMPAYVLVKQQSVSALRVPASAVVPGQMPMLWIETKEDVFEPRMVKLGASGNNWVEIKSGLNGGEKVVAKGVYLLQSEYILKKGNDPMAGHNH